ncbi:MAG: CHRD domain-containing protein [Deltaproteobacteria bacterium]|jgi:hypothetical protein
MKPRRIFISLILSLALPCLAWAATPQSFTAQLSGAQEVPPVKSKATGQAEFHLTQDGKALHYKITVTDLDNVTMAHIHLGKPGKNGPIAVWLYPVTGPPPALKPGKFTGILAKGAFTAKSLAGPLKGKPLKSLIEAMKNSRAYVNIHTTAHPEGELRGKIAQGKGQ